MSYKFIMKIFLTSLYRRMADRKNIPILVILMVAFLIRIIGINFGLPFGVVPDESAMVYVPLRMIELKSIIPALHYDAFAGKFYYMPFIAYIYIIPFLFVLGVKFLLFYGTVEEFKKVLQLDLSSFFITLRALNAFIGVATVYVVYKISENIFKNKRPALLSAAFLSLSLLHIIFSHWARHWVVSAFVVSLVLYILTHPAWSKEKRYLSAATICGIGIGMMFEISILALLPVIWFFLCDKLSFFKEIKQKWTWLSVSIFFSIFILALLIWPKGAYSFQSQGNLIDYAHNIARAFTTGYKFYFFDILERETTLLIFFFVGAVIGFKKMRKYFLPILSSVLLYVLFLYIAFNDLTRLILFIYPFLAVVAGYGLSEFLNIFRDHKVIVYTVIGLVFLPLAANAVLFDYLLVKNDTRTQAFEWINQNIPAKSKILILAPALRLPATAESIKEQENIDATSLRTVDRVEESLDDKFFTTKRFNALNLHAVVSSAFYFDICDYIIREKYEYLVFNDDFAKVKGVRFSLDKIGSPIKEYQGETVTDINNPIDGANLNVWRLLFLPNFGPSVKIYKVDTLNNGCSK